MVLNTDKINNILLEMSENVFIVEYFNAIFQRIAEIFKIKI